MSLPSIDDINKLVGLQLGVRDVRPTDRFAEDLGAESADVANIISAVEAKYKVEIKEAEIARIFTPADLLALILTRI